MNPVIKKKLSNLTLVVILILTVLIIALLLTHLQREAVFDGKRALDDVRTQVAFGARTPGSTAHQAAGNWILGELTAAGWEAEEQTAVVAGHPIRNLIARSGSGKPWYILGAHYDSRMKADQDQVSLKQTQPVPGANDGASGVAVLLELARALPEDMPGQVWLVFFDAEDQGNLPGWDWILGSRYFADTLQGIPDGVVVVDMIGDAELTIYKERNSDEGMTTGIWEAAARAGYGQQFPSDYKYQMLDDHLPFLERGIPATLLIDFDYPWWHTTSDTLDKVSAASLDVVGESLYRWIMQKMNDGN